MNSEQLKKINELVNEVNGVKSLLSRDGKGYTVKTNIDGVVMNFKPEVITPAVIDYLDELNAKLKKLGYED
jgi:hypothetical protein